MIVKLFNHPHILQQTPEHRHMDVPSRPIAGHIDNGGTICPEQESLRICINRASVPELFELLENWRLWS
jgi:hypothetical protein